MPTTDHLPVAYNHGAHRNLSGGSRETGLAESQPHGRSIVPCVHSASNRSSTHLRFSRRRRVQDHSKVRRFAPDAGETPAFPGPESHGGLLPSDPILDSSHGRGIER